MAALDDLKQLSLVIEVSGSRVTRFEHNMQRVLKLPSQSVAVLATLLLLALVIASCWRRCWRPWLAALWLAGLALFFLLMRGGVAGLAPNTTLESGIATGLYRFCDAIV